VTPNRLLIVSNRLPVTAHTSGDGIRLVASIGGLATGLRPWHEDSGGLWIGWPGDVSAFSPAQREALDAELAQRALVPVWLAREHVDRFYHGFANRVLWPLLHYLIDRVPVDATGWDAYRQVNDAFAEVVAREYRPGDLIWVHDYQLMLVPALLRDRLPDARIGFFLHVPFPSSEVFRILPWRRELLYGLMGADVLGFHTFAYMRHFVSSLLHIEGVEADIDRVRIGDRDVLLGAYPMGIDTAQFTALAEHPDVVAEAAAIRRDANGRQIVLGVDRLDYTKGIPRRLQAVERLLEREPALRDTMRYVQVAVPSRGEVDSYQRFKQQVEKSVGAINGTWGTLRSAPVHYINRSISLRQLVALYCAADVMLVTPLRDGMNLVAKEFAASRADEDGVLVLSEFAGAATELDGAMIVNPYDVDAVAACIRRALSMPAGERRARMRALRRRVQEHDVHVWAAAFLDRLDSVQQVDRSVVTQPEPSLVTALTRAQRSGRLHLLLDYDGTLVPLARSPELAAPDDEVLELLEALAAVPMIHLDIVSGRPYQTLEAWFGHLDVSLWAEHGFWHRPSKDAPWQAAASVAADAMERIRPILEQFTASTPGSHMEVKTASLAWHYRRAQREFGARQAHELRMLLGDALSNQPFEVLEGHKVIEVRLRGVSKALVAQRMPPSDANSLVIAIGDDRTDEDLFAALQASSLTVAVGRRPTRARFRIDDYRAVRQILRLLLAESRTAAPDWGAAVDPVLPGTGHVH
jgi:trehalose 6-phosphate synthase/phosphatase